MTDAERDRLVEQISDPSTGEIRRRWLRRKLMGIRSVGPDAPPAKEPPTKADAIRAIRQEDRLARQHDDTISAEIAALDAHAKAIEKALPEARPDPSERLDYRTQENYAELRQLRELRAMLEEDRAAGPVRLDRDGRPISNRTRSIIRHRAAEIAESLWADAARADAEGDFRRGRQLRRDALRSRHVCEYEMCLRSSLPGYGISPWT